jgi:CDP-diacylglycerol--glycerol-3-phosphate 3-phosphatidyltransferase
LAKVAGVLDALGLTPNALTVIGLVLNLAVAGVLATGHLRIGGALVLVASLFDGLDGALARHTGKVSKFGAFFDSTLDRYAEAALFTGLVWHFSTIGARQETVLAVVALFGSLAVSYTRARAEGLGLTCSVGILTRAERIVLLTVGLAAGLPLLTLWVLAILTHITAIQRIVHVYRVTRTQ